VPAPALLVSSPLRRALDTAVLAFEKVPVVPRLVSRLARERIYHASDLGSPPALLAEHYGDHWGGIEDLGERWWHDNGEPAGSYELEPEAAFAARVASLRAWLRARPESCIALVSHWGVLRALTGEEFANCELRTVSMDDIDELAAGSSRH
jgi:broad specificity phosphatase PhoE